MVEKWMRGNKMPHFAKSKARYGMPSYLFKDSDRDGVPNVFDCKPYNKRKQDVLGPLSGGNPMQEMIQRQENARQQANYLRYLRAVQKAEEERAAELRRLSNVQIIDRTVSYGAMYPDPYIFDSSGKGYSLRSKDGQALKQKMFGITPSTSTSTESTPTPKTYKVPSASSATKGMYPSGGTAKTQIPRINVGNVNYNSNKGGGK